MGGYFNIVSRQLIILSYPTSSGLIYWKPAFCNFDFKRGRKNGDLMTNLKRGIMIVACHEGL
jgi:hypothetical protein